MSRFVYDVDKITRYIDIHKQFGGGLKTVDTDDSLRDIYLREAENISLSEFNFIEKRYGLHKLEEHMPWSSLTSVSSIVQGYFEYYVDADTVDKIIVIEGKFYVNRDGNGFEEVEFFTRPAGTPFFDLAPLGIYTDDVVNEITTGSVFGTQVPRFAENHASLPTTSPFGGATSYVIYAFSNDTYYAWVPSTSSYTTIGTSATDSYPGAGFVQGEFYHDTRRNVSYKWTATSGKTGIMEVNENIYRADIQTTRPVEGVRVDDKLYIATGTYPVYYMGDGKIYVFPQYEHSDLDVQNLGYNLNSLDLEADFATPAFTATSSQGTTLNSETVAIDSVTIKDSQISKRFPFVAETIPTEIKVATHLYNNASSNRWGGTGTDVTVDSNLFDSQMTAAELDAWLGTPTVGVDLNTIYGQITEDQTPETFGAPVFTNRRYRTVLKPTIYIKPAGALPSLYEEITSVGNLELNNDVQSNSSNRLPNSSIALSNFVFQLKELATGYWDFKIEFKLTQTGYFYPGELATQTNLTTEYNVVRTKTLDVKVVEFTNIWVTPEELVDYKEEPYDSLKIHTCNRVIEHNGRLGFFGSTVNPDYLFFSTIGAKEYFPYRYSLQFTNDLKEAITAVNRFMNILVVQSDSFTFGIKGDCPFPLTVAEGDIYRKIMINPTIGCIAPHSVKNVRNQLYFLSKEGVFTLRALYAEDNRYNVDPIDRNIYNIVPRDTNAICAYFDDQYWLHFPTTGETLRYYVDKKAWVKDTYSAWNQFGGIHKYINESGKLRFITELSQFEDEDDLKIFDVELDYSLPSDLGQFFESRVTTSFLNQNQPFHPKNYKEAKMDFTIQNEYNIGKEPIYGIEGTYGEGGTSPTQYILFDANLTKRHFYQITLDKVNVPTSSDYAVYINNGVTPRATGTFTETDPESQSWLPIEFQILDTDTMPCQIKIVSEGFPIVGGALTTVDESVAVLKDSTYDNSITFTNVILSEEGTLNVDPIQSYSQSAVERVINLGTRLGNWTFGTSDFGNIITAVETIKLAGKGYNCKISITETGKSKWTLESLGITYKMKKARSR
jgi:hypothetical protein